MSISTYPPIFLSIAGHTVNVREIKRAGQGEQVYIEFITGGTTYLPHDVSIEEFNRALSKAIEDAAPY